MLSGTRLSAIFTALLPVNAKGVAFRYLHAVNCRRFAYSRIIATFFLQLFFSKLDRQQSWPILSFVNCARDARQNIIIILLLNFSKKVRNVPFDMQIEHFSSSSEQAQFRNVIKRCIFENLVRSHSLLIFKLRKIKITLAEISPSMFHENAPARKRSLRKC